MKRLTFSVCLALAVLTLSCLAAAAEEKKSPVCRLEPSQLVEYVKKEITAIPREAKFETHLITGGRTVPLYVSGADPQMVYEVVAASGTPDQHEQAVSTGALPDRNKKPTFNKVTITGVELQGIDTKDTREGKRTVLYIQVPELGWLWPNVTFYLASCPSDGTQGGFVAMVQGRVSNAWLAQSLSFSVVVLVYILAAIGVWKISVPPVGFSKSLNPLRLTAGIGGQSSVSNLQIFTFTLIVLGLLVYVLLRTGELTDISANVAWLLGIVGAGTGAARLVASHRQQIEPINLAWLLKRGWVSREPSVANLVTEGGEFSVTRFQSIAFSLIVAIALLISGPGELATFTIPASILGLLVASQAIYVGGKWIQPTADVERAKEINDALSTVRAVEMVLIKNLPAGTAQNDLEGVIKNMAEFPEYTQKAATAANLVAAYFEVEMPGKGLCGVPLS